MEEPPWRIIAPVGRRSGVAVLRAVLAGLLLVFLAILGLVVAGEGRHVGEGSVLLGRLSTGAALGKRSESQWSDLLTDESIYRRLMGSVALSLQRKRANGAAELQRLAMIQGTSRGRLDTEKADSAAEAAIKALVQQYQDSLSKSKDAELSSDAKHALNKLQMELSTLVGTDSDQGKMEQHAATEDSAQHKTEVASIRKQTKAAQGLNDRMPFLNASAVNVIAALVDRMLGDKGQQQRTEAPSTEPAPGVQAAQGSQGEAGGKAGVDGPEVSTKEPATGHEVTQSSPEKSGGEGGKDESRASAKEHDSKERLHSSRAEPSNVEGQGEKKSSLKVPAGMKAGDEGGETFTKVSFKVIAPGRRSTLGASGQGRNTVQVQQPTFLGNNSTDQTAGQEVSKSDESEGNLARELSKKKAGSFAADAVRVRHAQMTLSSAVALANVTSHGSGSYAAAVKADNSAEHRGVGRGHEHSTGDSTQKTNIGVKGTDAEAGANMAGLVDHFDVGKSIHTMDTVGGAEKDSKGGDMPDTRDGGASMHRELQHGNDEPHANEDGTSVQVRRKIEGFKEAGSTAPETPPQPPNCPTNESWAKFWSSLTPWGGCGCTGGCTCASSSCGGVGPFGVWLLIALALVLAVMCCLVSCFGCFGCLWIRREWHRQDMIDKIVEDAGEQGPANGREMQSGRRVDEKGGNNGDKGGKEPAKASEKGSGKGAPADVGRDSQQSSARGGQNSAGGRGGNDTRRNSQSSSSDGGRVGGMGEGVGRAITPRSASAMSR